MKIKKFLKVVYKLIGLSTIVSSLIIVLMIFVSNFLFGGIILYENNKVISIVEIIMVINAMIFLIGLFKNNFGKGEL